MAVVVVGGHSRNIGKTSVVSGLISALPRFQWTAIKITQYGHGVCSANGEPCDCETDDHTIAVSEERSRDSGTDSSRYLAAGAMKSFWVRTRQGQLAEAMPAVRKLLDAAQHVIIESNSVLRFLQPLLSITVVDPSVADFKPSALRYLDRADAVVLPAGTSLSGWQGVSRKLLDGKRLFPFVSPNYCSEELVSFVAAQVDRHQSRIEERNTGELICEPSL